MYKNLKESIFVIISYIYNVLIYFPHVSWLNNRIYSMYSAYTNWSPILGDRSVIHRQISVTVGCLPKIGLAVVTNETNVKKKQQICLPVS